MIKNITLEMSLKPFKKTDDAYIHQVCKKMFEQWKPLLKNRETISIMLWVGDGSEMLDYSGEPDKEFEWCKYVGTANKPLLSDDEPKETSLHKKKQYYVQNPPKMNYGILKNIIKFIKTEGKEQFPNAKIRVGETFDIGPEFAISDFKYNRHKEICTDARLDAFGFVDATAQLLPDTYKYAAYPDGIPEGTQFGTFLGKQADVFLRDMGFDYLWLSNGLGFSDCPWSMTGKIFDGENYYVNKLDNTKKKIFKFWKLFRKECNISLETRGTNNSVGIDYATDGVPLYDIYNGNLDIIAPPNSPWAALNDNFGLEMMGHMTRICELPNDTFPFRYYLHDPWWMNSPWYDRYDGSPCDIYLPMSISRITAQGEIESANSLNILSIDNSYGTMPDSCANEVIPHLLKAEKDSSDEPSPIVWIYPMREYTTSHNEDTLKEMNMGDRFICDAINDGFPLCCVTSTDSFLQHDFSLYKKSILLSPVPENDEVLKKLIEFEKKGAKIIIYGSDEKLNSLPCMKNTHKINIGENPTHLRDAISSFGYSIDFIKKYEDEKPTTLSLARYDNALMFSTYNSDTTITTKFKFPLGAPVLCGTEAEIDDGYSMYRFIRGEHRECRVFVNQKDGIISCRENAPINTRYRRSLRLKGFKDATVYLFGEKSCEIAVTTTKSNDATPVYDERFKLVHDDVYGTYLKGEHINGDVLFLIGHRNTL